MPTPPSKTETTTADVLIVGGGIWGLSTAYHLVKSGRSGKVIVLERNAELADETTRQAAGQIGRIRSHPLMARAVGYTLALLRDFQKETGHDPGIHTPGSLHLALSAERMAAFERLAAPLSELGIEWEFLDDAQVRQMAPAVDVAQIEGALFVHGDGYVDARQAALAYAGAAGDLGADIRLGINVEEFVKDGNGRITGVRAGQEIIEGKHIVITCGPWTAALAQEIGFRVPVCGIRLQQGRTAPDLEMPADHPVVRIPDHSCYLRPEKGGYLYGYFDPNPVVMDPREPGAPVRTQQIAPSTTVLDEAKRRISPILPILNRLEIDEYRQGMITCAPDGWYVVGPIPDQSRLWLATGCAGMGIAGSGAVGNWLANWITTGNPGEDLSVMSPDRFAELINDQDNFRRQCLRTFANYYSLDGGVTYRK